MNAFTRGIEPKAAMATGVERCGKCYKILNGEVEKEWHYCVDCLSDIYGIDKNHRVNIWDRLTTFAKVAIITIGILTIYLIINLF